MTLKFLNLLPYQIDEIAVSIGGEVKPSVQIKPSPEAKAAALSACADAGIAVPACGYFLIEQLDAAAAKSFPPEHPLSIQRKLAFKSTVHAGGLLAEKSAVDNRTVVIAGLMLKKAGIPLPKDRPYSVAEFDQLMAGKQISPTHRIEIKVACLQAGLLEDGRVPPNTGRPIAAAAETARSIVDSLGLELPPLGTKLSIGKVDNAMDRKGWDRGQRVRSKNVLANAGVI